MSYKTSVYKESERTMLFKISAERTRDTELFEPIICIKNPQHDSNQGINNLNKSNLMLQSLQSAIWQHLWHIWSLNSVQGETELTVPSPLPLPHKIM